MQVGNYDIPQQYITDISDQWDRSIQQTTSQLKNCATVITGIEGSEHEFNRVGTTELQESKKYNPSGSTWEEKGRHEDITIDELSTANGFMLAQDFHKHLWAQYNDKKQLGGIDLTLQKAPAEIMSAYERRVDEVILGVDIDTATGDTKGLPIINPSGTRYNNGGIFGITKYGLKIGTATGVALPSAATIAASIGGASLNNPAPMNIKKILRARRKLGENRSIRSGIGGMSKVCLLVTEEMVSQLIEDEERLGDKSFGFNALVTGDVVSLAGVTFIKTEGLPYVKVSDGVYVRRAVMYSPEHLLFGVWDGMHIEIKDQGQKVKSYTVGGYCSIGAARKNEMGFATIDCLTDTLD